MIFVRMRTLGRGVGEEPIVLAFLHHQLNYLFLGAFRYMGKKCTFDCLEELTFVSQRTHEQFFQQFITNGGTTLYQIHVLALHTPAQADEHMHEMRTAEID